MELRRTKRDWFTGHCSRVWSPVHATVSVHCRTVADHKFGRPSDIFALYIVHPSFFGVLHEGKVGFYALGRAICTCLRLLLVILNRLWFGCFSEPVWKFTFYEANRVLFCLVGVLHHFIQPPHTNRLGLRFSSYERFFEFVFLFWYLAVGNGFRK